MIQFCGHEIRWESLTLCLTETLTGFLAVYAVLELGLTGGPGRDEVEIVLLAMFIAVSSGFAASVSGLHEKSVLSCHGRVAVSGAIATVLIGLLAWLGLKLIAPSAVQLNPSVIAVAVALSSIMAVGLARLVHFAVVRRGFLMDRILFIGDGSSFGLNKDEMYSPDFIWLNPSEAFKILEAHWLSHKNIRTVVFDDFASNLSLIQHCREKRIRVLSQDRFVEIKLKRVVLDHLPAGWLIEPAAAQPSLVGTCVRRGLDIAAALALLLITLPVMLATAIIIKLDSDGPIFYRQERCGLHNRPFMMWKFRSMIVDAEVEGVPVWAATPDSRVTRFGRIIRLVRIDELPQLLNVLLGEMAMVGPRPERPSFVAKLTSVLPHYHYRTVVKPGITGWAQVNYRYGSSIEDARIKLSYDLYYISRRSLFLDLVIFVSTVRVILLQEGAR